MEFVEIWNKNSGALISTYVIVGERGSRSWILNGAAARTCQPGDPLIICNAVYVEEAELTALKPRVLTFDRDNHITGRLTYSVERNSEGGYSFSVLDEAGAALPPIRLCTRSANQQQRLSTMTIAMNVEPDVKPAMEPINGSLPRWNRDAAALSMVCRSTTCSSEPRRSIARISIKTGCSCRGCSRSRPAAARRIAAIAASQRITSRGSGPRS